MSRSGFSPMQPPGLHLSCHAQIPKMLLVSLPLSSLSGSQCLFPVSTHRQCCLSDPSYNIVIVVVCAARWKRGFCFSSRDHGGQISGAEQVKSESELLLEVFCSPPGVLT